VAGVTVAALAVPSAMAYAEVARLSPVNGLYALLLPTVAYVLLGSSRQLIVGPEGSVSTLVAVAILPLAAADSTGAVELAAMLASSRPATRSRAYCASAGLPTTSRAPCSSATSTASQSSW
jgi:MFS superfamily sulfate permease-like transporter